jgi:hypothetical protein
MSFSLEEIAEELLDAHGRGQEWFSRDSYSFCRFSKPRDDDLRRLAEQLRSKRKFRALMADPTRAELHRIYKAMWMRIWRRQNPEAARKADQAKHLRAKKTSSGRERLRRAWAKQNLRRKTEPAKRERSRELARKYYHKAVQNPVRRSRIRELARLNYRRRKERQSTASDNLHYVN